MCFCRLDAIELNFKWEIDSKVTHTHSHTSVLKESVYLLLRYSPHNLLLENGYNLFRINNNYFDSVTTCSEMGEKKK